MIYMKYMTYFSPEYCILSFELRFVLHQLLSSLANVHQTFSDSLLLHMSHAVGLSNLFLLKEAVYCGGKLHFESSES